MAATKKNVTRIVREIAAPVAENFGCELWNVEYFKEPTEWILEITIDKAGGVSIDDCEKVHRAVDPLIDEADPIEGSYSLQVSSPGLDRELKLPEHFKRFTGSPVTVKLFVKNEITGAKTFDAILSGADFTANTLTFALEGGQSLTIPKKEVAKVNLCEDLEEL